mmetsp:Transcript_80348/g.162763  ORF Transcript_80348/g.162763 Transcript_80348/m.162763 type:complete len:275 (-) Transcript_80348:473-1297(-)
MSRKIIYSIGRLFWIIFFTSSDQRLLSFGCRWCFRGRFRRSSRSSGRWTITRLQHCVAVIEFPAVKQRSDTLFRFCFVASCSRTHGIESCCLCVLHSNIHETIELSAGGLPYLVPFHHRQASLQRFLPLSPDLERFLPGCFHFLERKPPFLDQYVVALLQGQLQLASFPPGWPRLFVLFQGHDLACQVAGFGEFPVQHDGRPRGRGGVVPQRHFQEPDVYALEPNRVLFVGSSGGVVIGRGSYEYVWLVAAFSCVVVVVVFAVVVGRGLDVLAR